MKDLFLHLWKNSRVFQVALLVGGVTAGWSLLGRPSQASQPQAASNQPATVDTIMGNTQVPGVTKQDAAQAKDSLKSVLNNSVNAANTVAGAIEKGAKAGGDAIDWGRRQVEGKPTDPKTAPAPTTPKAP